MSWSQQRQLVKSLADQAQDKKREASRVRGNLHNWVASYLGNVETLAWVFAMGTFFAAGRSPAAKSSATRRSMIAAVNTSLLAWQLVNRKVTLAQPAADQPSEESP
ncbi:MAG: hypothetical protein WBM54_05075 [Woeseia sp.]